LDRRTQRRLRGPGIHFSRPAVLWSNGLND
jgi:hypothetical protein